MNELKLTYSIVTSLFGHGAYQNQVEIRPSEIKGMMRYVYRIACPSSISDLFAAEKELFGGAAGEDDDRAGREEFVKRQAAGGHASPVRLLVRWSGGEEKEKLLLHDKKGPNFPRPCVKRGRFQVIMRMNPSPGIRPVIDCGQCINLPWYADLLRLGFILCGIGGRSRKGRGRADAVDSRFRNKEEAMRWICNALNQTARASVGRKDTDLYVCNKDGIAPMYCALDVKHPVIQEIRFGNCLDQKRIPDFLAMVDELCHDDYYKDNSNRHDRAIGSANPRFASSLWIGMAQTAEGAYPVYLFVTAIKQGGRRIDRDCNDRKQFVDKIEKRMGNGGSR